MSQEPPANPSADILATGPLDLVVHWDAQRPTVRPDVQAFIDAHWNAYVADARRTGGNLFDGPVARLVDFRIRGTTLELSLQLSDYKTFLVTALRNHDWFAAQAPDAVVGALGVSALLCHENRCLLGIRSPSVAAYPGRAHIFGGVLENLGTPDRPANLPGLLAHLRQELAEELGLTPADLRDPPRLLLLARDRILHQPELIWQWELAAPIETILHRLNDQEHTGHLIVDRHTPLDSLRPALTPSARLAVEFWRTRI